MTSTTSKFTSGGLNLWATAPNTSLTGKDKSDVFHAVFDNVRMKGGAGADHFHIKAGTKNTEVLDFKYFEGDLLLVDGYKKFDATKLNVESISNGVANVSYTGEATDGTTQTTEFKLHLFHNGTGSATAWNPIKSTYQTLLTGSGEAGRHVRVGYAQADAENYTMTSPFSTIYITGARPVYINGFDVQKDHSLNFQSLNLDQNTRIEYYWNEAGSRIDVLALPAGKKPIELAYINMPASTANKETWKSGAMTEIYSALVFAGFENIAERQA